MMITEFLFQTLAFCDSGVNRGWFDFRLGFIHLNEQLFNNILQVEQTGSGSALCMSIAKWLNFEFENLNFSIQIKSKAACFSFRCFSSIRISDKLEL